MKRILLALSIPLTVLMVAKNIVLATTESIDQTVLWKSPGTIVKGDYVSYQINDPIIGDQLIIKQVGCTEGSHIALIEQSFYCNGTFIGQYKLQSKTGLKLSPTKALGQIPRGQVWLMGTHKDSYDSRYFGLVSKEQLLRLNPIL